MSVLGTTPDKSTPEQGSIDMSPEELQKRKKELEHKQVSSWNERIKSAEKLNVYEEQKKSKDEAKQFYRGNIIPEKERAGWGGDEVEANLFRRTVNFMADAIYANNPKLNVKTRRKISATTQMGMGGGQPGQPGGNGQGGMAGGIPQVGGGIPPTNGASQPPQVQNPGKDPQKGAEALKTHLEYILDEEDLRSEIKRVWKDSYFGNLSAAKLDFDVERGLWRFKWVAGILICDPDAHGDLYRARWLAERVVLPRYRIWQDETFDPIARKEIKERASQTSISYNDNPNNDAKGDSEILWYIYTKEGVDPLEGTDSTKNRLLVLCENYDGWLLNIENPTPFLDNDEFPYSILRLDELPGEFIGPALWKQVRAIVVAFNWAASYHMSDMRKTASRPIAYNKNSLDDPKLLESRKHMVPIPFDVPLGGSVDGQVKPVEIGQSDKTIFESVMFFRDMLDKVTGIDDIARGEEGRTKTATESQILQQNSNIALRGPSEALDYFMNDVIRKLGLASLYYTPAFSITQSVQMDPMTGQQVPVFMTRIPQMMPMVDPMTGLPAMDPMTGQMGMQQQIVPVVAEGATAPVKGIDYFHGDEVALNWPQLPFEEIKCDISFAIEAGSTRAERRQEKQRQALELLGSLGVELQQLGMQGERWELWNIVLDSYEIDKSKVLPPKEQFMMQAQMMQMMQMQAQAQAGSEGKGKPGEKKTEGGTNKAGTDFPMSNGPNVNKDRSSGGST